MKAYDARHGTTFAVVDAASVERRAPDDGKLTGYSHVPVSRTHSRLLAALRADRTRSPPRLSPPPSAP